MQRTKRGIGAFASTGPEPRLRNTFGTNRGKPLHQTSGLDYTTPLMQSRNRNVLLGALASGGFALSLPAGRIAGACLRESCDLSVAGDQIPVTVLSVGTALLVFHIGARLGRIRSGWLAALLLCSSFGWIIGMREPLSPFLITFATTLVAAVILKRPPSKDTSLPPRAIRVLWSGVVGLLVLSTAWDIFSVASPGISLRDSPVDLGVLTIFPWIFVLVAVGDWQKNHPQAPPAWGFLASWVLLAFWLSLIAARIFWSDQPIHRMATSLPVNMMLPILPPLALIAGLTLGPGPEGKRPRRMVRLNMEIIAATGMITAFLLLSAMVAPLETLLPEKLGNLWQGAFGGLRSHGVLTMLLAFGMLGLSVATIQQARGAHWFRASLPLALLISLLHMFLA